MKPTFFHRRNLLLGLGALAAAGAGAWLWRTQEHAQQAALADVRHDLPPGFWAIRVPRPDGSELALGQFQGQPLLVNFWATWCPPCVEEMPLLDAFGKAHAAKGIRVVGLAIDGPTPVREFLSKHPVQFPIGLAGLEGNDLLKALGNSGGQLPFTVWIHPTRPDIERHRGLVTPELLERWAQTAV
jgi:thiol-disulfide isomerase/thioredoxin